MVGGSEAAFERVLPLFELMGKNITLWAATATARPPRWPTRSSWR
jgi:3-hydroxyisobutyrate dehydrogenase-like beta-hydroxyacid dehydrogenase